MQSSFGVESNQFQSPLVQTEATNVRPQALAPGWVPNMGLDLLQNQHPGKSAFLGEGNIYQINLKGRVDKSIPTQATFEQQTMLIMDVANKQAATSCFVAISTWET